MHTPKRRRSGPPPGPATNTCQGESELFYSLQLLIFDPTPSVPTKSPVLREQGVSSLIKDLHDIRSSSSPRRATTRIQKFLLKRAGTGSRHGWTHANNGDVLSWMTKQLETKGLWALKYHTTSRPQIVGMEATDRTIASSSILDVPTHTLILDARPPSAAAPCIRQAQTKGPPIMVRHARSVSSSHAPISINSDLGRQMRLFTAAS